MSAGRPHPERDYYVKNLVKPAGKFTRAGDKKIGHMEGAILESTSRDEDKHGLKKFWVSKVPKKVLFARLSDGSAVSSNLEKRSEEEAKAGISQAFQVFLNEGNTEILTALELSLNEVIAGEFALLALGRGDSPVTALTKSDVAGKPFSILSRMKYPDCVDLFEFIEKIIPSDGAFDTLIGTELSGLSEVLALKILMGDSDIKLDSFMTYYFIEYEGFSPHDSTGKNDVYGIDWEQSFAVRINPFAVFDIFNDPKKMSLHISEIKSNLSSFDPDERKLGLWLQDLFVKKIDKNEVRGLITKLANLPEEHIKLIGERLKEQCAANGVVLDEKTSAFVDGRIERLLEIKRACQAEIAKAPAAQGFAGAVLEGRAAAERIEKS